MIFQSYIPNPPLDQFVEHFLYHEGIVSEHSVDRFLPDGNTEIIIDLDDEPKYIYDNETLEKIQTCQNIWASGIRTKPISIHSGEGTPMLIIFFKKGMAASFFPLPMNELSDTVIDAELLLSKEFLELREMLLDEKAVPKRFEIVERFLLDLYVEKLIVNECVDFAIDKIETQPDQVCLGNLYEKIGYSQKHFTNIFRSNVGITPKSFLKIVRFQKAIADIERNESPNWTEIALEAGFYDQAHFINDFKKFSGFTPNDYLRRKNGILNYVPVS